MFDKVNCFSGKTEKAGEKKMKFYIGEMVVKVKAVPEHPVLKGFFRRPVDGYAEANFRWDIEVVTKQDWHYEAWDCEDGVWFTGRRGHYFEYDGSKNKFTLKIMRELDKENLYWLRRDLFGGFGSVSCQQVIHSSAVIKDGQGYVFSAPSETGKTTLFNNLCDYAEQVNDESNWVYQNEEGRFMLVNQNYYLGSSDIHEVPLAGLYLLEQATDCEVIATVDAMEAFTILLSIHPPFNYFDPFLEDRSAAIRHLQKNFTVKKFLVNLKPEEIAETLFG